MTSTEVASYVATNGAMYVKRLAVCPASLHAKRIKSGNYRIEDGQLQKRCSRCKEHWPADSEFFYSMASSQDGLHCWCKACYQQWRYPNGRSQSLAQTVATASTSVDCPAVTYRDKVSAIIAEVVRQVGRSDPHRLRTEIRMAYPFGSRAGWPYKAWLLEVKAQIGGMRPAKPDPNQQQLF